MWKWTAVGIHARVLAEPFPVRLFRALRSVPLVPADRVHRVQKAIAYGVPSLDPADLTPSLRRTLQLLCEGMETREIADETGWSPHTVADHRKALMAIFRARNAVHLAAIACSTGFVKLG